MSGGQTRRHTSPEYFAWRGMINRCTSPRNSAYRYYGGRGVTVCPQWMASFDAFLADVGPRPSAHHSIDRIDNDGNYEPSNVRWATLDEQANNKRRTVRLTSSGGETLTLSQWARRLNIGKSTLRNRLDQGWPVDRILGAAPSLGHPQAYIDMTGQRYGRLTALYRDTSRPRCNSTRWVCRCDCGKTTITTRLALISRRGTKSCGCLKLDALRVTTQNRIRDRHQPAPPGT